MSTAPQHPASALPHGAIAIVGMACRFPGATTPDQLWRNILGKVESVQFFSEAELLEAGVPQHQLERPNYVRAAAVLDEIDGFDAALFGISAREARVLDPQHRIFLECCWAALEDAALDPSRSEARVGVFAGSNLSDYALQQLDALAGGGSAAYMEALVGNDKDYLSTRVSYRLNLRGPSLCVGTACSTSLTAVALGCQSLQTLACDVVLAGGVCITLPRVRGYEYGSEGDALSSDGHCRAFDAAASGTAPGQGAGVVVLKRLADAVADADPIYAVIRGYALNNDGSDKVGYWAPGITGQTEAVLEALELAGIDAADIGYVEAHGTGTPLGDPIEIAALTAAFRAHTSARGYCAVGSIKTNIGHTSQAAGVAGLMKATLAVHHAQLPPSLNFEAVNPRLQLPSTPFYVNTEPRPWPGTRRAGVSSLGLGGTNVHVVLEQAPAPMSQEPVGPALLPLAANSERAFIALTQQLASHLAQHGELSLQSVAASLQRGRRQLPYRGYLVASSLAQAADALDKGAVTRRARRIAARAPEVVFVFPGASSVDLCAVARLAAAFPSLREALAEGVQHASGLGIDLGALLEPAPDAARSTPLASSDYALELPRNLASVLVVEVALARFLLELGVRPAAVLGHSSGEYAAACVSGALDLGAALELQIGRARLLASIPKRGAMLSVNVPADQLAGRLPPGVEVSAYNADDVSLLSGEADVLSALEGRLSGEGLVCQPSSVLGAAHSRFVDPILAPLGALAAQLKTAVPTLPWISSTSGELMPAAVPTAEHWVKHTRAAVRFVQAVGVAACHEGRMFVELGPGGHLSTLITRIVRARGLSNPAYSSMPGPKSDAVEHLLSQVARLWTAGAPVDLVALGQTRGVVPARLPTYPFEHVRYWIDPGERDPRATHQAGAALDIGPISASGPYLYRPIWVRTPLPSQAAADRTLLPWAVVSDGCPLCAALVAQAQRHNRELVQLDDAAAKGAVSYRHVIERLAERCPDGAVVLHCHAGAARSSDAGARLLEPPALAHALSGSGYAAPLQWVLLTRAAQPVLGHEEVPIAISSMAAAVRVLPRELPNVQARWLDLECEDRPRAWEDAAQQVCAELATPASFHDVAFRHGRRWQREYRRVGTSPDAATAAPALLREGGRYLITGGLGRMGLSLAQYLAELPAVSLALTHTRELPDEATWPQHANEDAEVGSTGQILHALLQLRARNLRLQIARVDAADEDAMRALVARLQTAWGGVDGVFHFAATLEDKAFGLLSDESTPAVDTNTGPKARGALVLAQLARTSRFEFCCLASSIAAELGGLGNYGYASANRALDALALRLNQSAEGGGARWLSVNFDYYRPQSAEDGRLDPREQRSGAIQRLRSEGALRGRDLLQVFQAALPLVGEAQLIACGKPIEQHVARYLERGRPRSTRAARPDLASELVPPHTDLQRELVELWQELLCVEPIGIRDDFFELGGDSLLVLRLSSTFRERYSRQLPVKTLIRSPTVEQLAEQIERGGQSVELIALRPLDLARHTLFCVPYAGGSALGFRALTAALPADWAVWVLPAAREVDDLDALLDTAAQTLHDWPTSISIYGHCGGSFAAVELARKVEQLGRAPESVVAAATLPPRHGTTLADNAQSGQLGQPNLEARQDVLELLTSLGGLPEHAGAEDAREAFAAMHDDGVRLSALFERFRSQAAAKRLRTPLLCMFGGADPMTSEWRERASEWHAYFEHVELAELADAGHYFVHTQPDEVARMLLRALTT